MSGWTDEQLDRIGNSDEFAIASRRADGTLSPYVTIWDVRAGNELYVRSAYGPDNGWYRRARTRGIGRLKAGGVEQDVTFTEPDNDAHAGIDAGYHAKYDSYGPNIVGSVVGPAAAVVTLRLEVDR